MRTIGIPTKDPRGVWYESGFGADEPDAFNTVHTIDVPDDVNIDNLAIVRVRQRVPDNKPPVRIADGAKILQLDGQPAGAGNA